MAKASAPNFRGLPLRARAYIPFILVGAAVALFAATTWGGGHEDLDVALFITAAVLCAAGNLFEVFAPGHFSFQPNLAFFFGASLMLPPWAIAVLAVVCFAPGWVLHHFRWYMVSFNIANYVLAGLAAYEIAELGDAVAGGSPDASGVLALAAAAAAFVLINHLLIVVVVTLARGRPLARSVEDMVECLPVDGALAITGACLAVLWAITPPLAALAAGPMLLMYRALWVPLLEHKSRTDPKTGLYNSEYLATEMEDALAQSRRRGLPLSLLMIDMDQLRAVNNLHGHLAGDRLIKSVADLVRDLAGQTGLAARFGGDELCLLLPNCPLEDARALAETVRRQVEELALPATNEGLDGAMRSTVSIGIACYPEHGHEVEALLQAADAAVYDAKLGGRNRIRLALPPGAREALDQEAPLPPMAEHPPPKAGPEPIRLEDLLMDVTSDDAPDAGSTPEPDNERHAWLVPWFAGALCAGTAVVGAFSGYDAIVDNLPAFVLLVAAVLALDIMRLDVFSRATVSPATVPTLALAAMFGPLGPIGAEILAALVNLIRRKAALKTAFDFGALALSGAVAALVFSFANHLDDPIMLPLGAAAGLAYYLCNSSLLAIVISLSNGVSPTNHFREGFQWLASHYPAFGVLAGTFVISELDMGLFAFLVFGLPVGMLWLAEKQYVNRTRNSVEKLRKSHDELEGANKQLKEALGENRHLLGRMHRSYLSTITSLARTIEAKDPYTGGHTERVAEISLMLAQELGFKGADLRAVRVGALIHDIGKIGVPDQVLLKPGSLNDLEFTEIKRHPEISSYILAELELPAVVKQMVRSHHECWNGTGYPDHLQGQEIPLAARILSVADALDAMTTDRPYRRALPPEVALAEIHEQAGSQFCPRVVAALERCIRKNPDLLDQVENTEPFDISAFSSTS